jgi:hypothetical protein
MLKARPRPAGWWHLARAKVVPGHAMQPQPSKPISAFLSTFPQERNLWHPSVVVGDDGHFAGLFSNPAAMRDLPGPVNCSLPARSIMYPSLINRALCSAGIAAGESFTAVLPTVRREANSCSLRRLDNLGTKYGPFPEFEHGQV